MRVREVAGLWRFACHRLLAITLREAHHIGSDSRFIKVGESVCSNILRGCSILLLKEASWGRESVFKKPDTGITGAR